MDPDREAGAPAPDQAPTGAGDVERPGVDTAVYVEAIDSAAPPVRRRRGGRALGIVLPAALAFLAGVLLQKSVVARSTINDQPPPVTEGANANGLGDAVFGQVKAVDGATIYVTDGRGNVTKVITTDGSTFATTAPTAISDIRPGDVVLVRGQQQPDGTVAATSVVDTGPSQAPPGAAPVGGGG